jgi:alpha-glucosidase
MAWWRNAVVYEVYVRSFADSNGDGVGDLAGIRSRLPYLRSLGVDAVWLTPFYRSPMVDAGYDVADYRDVDPLFGTLADFDGLVADAHTQGIRVIADIVPNHTSSEHAWFRAALAAGPGSPERDRYIFRTGRGAGGELPPNDWASVFGGPAWTRLPDGAWYLHLFAPEQPDLNWRNPEVHAEFLDTLRFWLDRGADGFRIDVAMGLYKAADLPDVGDDRPNDAVTRAGGPIWGRPETHDVYRAWRRLLDTYPGDRLAIGEVWTDSVDDLVRYIRPDELHQAFGFDWLMAPWSAVAFGKVIADTLAVTERGGAAPTWVLANHDMERTVTRYGGGPRGLARARAAALAMLALPGSAYLYQGEELGLPEVTGIPDDERRDPIWKSSGHTDPGRDGCRVPIPWDDDPVPHGFSSDGVRPWLPMPPGWGGYSVATQLADLDSTLRLYMEALRLRRDLADLPFAGPELSGDTVAFARGDAFTCVLNCGETPVVLPPHAEVLLASGPLGTDGPHALPPDTAVWLRTA